MKYFYVVFNVLLIVMISLFGFFLPKDKVISKDAIVRSLSTSSFLSIQNLNSESAEKPVDDSENIVVKSVSDLEKGLSNNITGAGIISDVLETQVGTMSAYGLDCQGCSGRVGAGYDASGNNVRYYDSTYGELRIVAGDRKYPYGTVVRVNNSTIGTFQAIVLDRGGDIGIGRRYMFDLLFYSEAEAYQFGLSRNTTFEILRYGY